jgi:hypothetical protein
MRNRLIDEIGTTHHWLFVHERAESPKGNRKAFWNCECLRCGKQDVIVAGTDLRGGQVQSCGCLHSDNARVNGASNAKRFSALPVRKP